MKKSHKVGERTALLKLVGSMHLSTMLLPANVSAARLEILRAAAVHIHTHT